MTGVFDKLRAGSGGKIEVAHHLNDLEGIPWDQLRLPAGLYQHRNWLALCEEMSSGPVRYLAVHCAAGGCAGVAPLYMFPEGEPAGLYAPEVTLGSALASRLARKPGFVSLGGRAGYLTGWSVTDSLPSDRTAAISSILTAAGAESEQLDAGLLSVQYLPAEQAMGLVETGLVRAHELIPQSLQARIPLGEGGFDRYLSDLSSARRSTVRRDLAAFQASSMRLTRSTLSEALDFAPHLLAEVQRRHGAQAGEALMRRMLETQARYLDSLSLVIAAAGPDGVPVAYSLSYLVGDGLYVRLVGLDHERVGRSAAYFITAYYEPIREACRLGLKFVHLGIGSLRPKALRGAVLDPLFGLFRGIDGQGITAAESRRLARRFEAAAKAQLGEIAPRISLALR